MIEASVCSVKYSFRSSLLGRQPTQQQSTISNQESSRLNPNSNFLSSFFRMLFIHLSHLRVKFVDIHQFILIFIPNSNTAPNVNVLKLGEFLTHFKYVSHCFDENFLVLLSQVRANVLMKSDDVNVVLLCLTNELVNVCVKDTELALWTSCNHLVSFSRPKVWIESDKDFLVPELVFVPF